MKSFIFPLLFLFYSLVVAAQNKGATLNPSKTQPKKSIADPWDKYIEKISPLHDKIIDLKDLNYGMKCFADAEYMISDNSIITIDEHGCDIALKYFEEAITAGFSSALLYAEKGMCEALLNKNEKSIYDLTLALSLPNKTPSDMPQDMFSHGEHYEFTDSGYVYKADKTEYLFNIRPSLVHIYRGQSKQNMKDFRGAVDDYIEATNWSSNNKNYNLYINLGNCLMQTEKYLSAKDSFNEAIKINKNDPVGYYLRGGANYNLSLKESACRDWSRAGELGYEKAYDDIKEYCNPK